MPLARFRLRNEYGLGVKELYREPSEIEDPKLVLDGVAVAGLVGLLRQLGDLAEFAAEVFHGLQEELTTTASKSRKLMTRVKCVEAALPPIEKAILSQTSHIHFTYAPGSDWHARIRNEQNHFIYTYLPRCIMDPYEECREPPRLQFLDKFDAGGPGSCLKRYSDPTFFRRLSGNSDINDETYHKGSKTRKAKRRRATKRSSQLPSSSSNFDSSDRMKVSLSSRPQQSSPAHTSSTYDMTVKSDLVERSGSPSSGYRMGFIECVFHPSTSEPDKTKIAQPLSVLDDKMMNRLESNFVDKQTSVVHDDVQGSSVLEKNTHRASSVTWDEKVEIVEPMALYSGVQDVPSLHATSSEFDKQEIVPTVWKSVDGEATKVNESNFEYEEPDIEPMRLNSGSYDTTEMHTKNFQLTLENGSTDHTSGRNEMSELYENFDLDDSETVPSGQMSWDNEISEVYKRSLEYDQQEMDPVIGEIVDFVGISHGTDSPNVTFDKNQPDDVESETDNFVDALNTIESESEKDLDCQTRREVEPYIHLKEDLDNKRIAGNNDDHPLELESPFSSFHDLNQTNFNTSHRVTSSLLSTCEESFQHSPASHHTSGKEVCVHADDLVSPLHLADNAPFQTILLSSIQNVSCGAELGIQDDNTDSLQQQSDLGELSSDTKETSMTAETDTGTICPPVPEQAPVECCNVNSVALWTKGGLLGLQPSKPPDSKTSDCLGISTGITACPSYQNLMPKDDNLQGKLDLPLRQLDCDDENANSQEPSLDSDAHEIGFSKDLPQSSSFDLDGIAKPIESNQIYLTPSVTHPETKDPTAADTRIRSNGTVHTNEDVPFLSGFRHGLLTDGFRRTGSAEYDEKPKAVSSQKTHDFENGTSGTFHHSIEGTNLKELTSPVNSPPPSPPLEHMKISFQPINNFETFKLKLKYPEGIDHHDDNVNIYPSFQLVPEPNHLHHDTVSDSDDDTYCRSNLCLSDGDVSHLSDLVWESGDSSESLDDRPYDGLHRISYDESISCSGEHGIMTTKRMHNIFESSKLQYKIGLTHASSGPISDIPVLNPTLYQDAKISTEHGDMMDPFSMRELTPEAPPLPPVQWRASNPLSNAVEGSESTPFNHLSSFSLCKNPGSAFAQLANPEPDNLNNTRIGDMNFITRNKQLDQVKLNSNTLEQTNQAADRSVDDQEDFLQQIRTTSFNLRKTGLLTPTCTSTPSTNVNVTAILQKASAIRKVVASDGEDTDPWSDT